MIFEMSKDLIEDQCLIISLGLRLRMSRSDWASSRYCTTKQSVFRACCEFWSSEGYARLLKNCLTEVSKILEEITIDH